ncbi:glycosyltransferase family 2 protein [Geobacter sp.]|uniref:glycosyltransferase family 2 protein n=1 Tax=Geobacter sp. TaxID=46610 RepID=UPI001AD2108C|nr:glycosyltransferase family 2 protein [Geobacter sp.]CAG1002742.1 Polyprenol monophosphomannose synthase [Gammaproteobacteria bacterium]
MSNENRHSHYAVTVVMPALNEEGCLAASVANVLESFSRCGIAGELIIVNDGSGDGTGTLAERLRGEHPAVIGVIHHESPRGIGAAFWAGVERAGGEAVVMIPGDGENDAGEILGHLPLLQRVDMVVPYVGNPQVRTPARRLLSALYGKIVNLSFGLSLKYLNGTVMYRREALRGIELKSGGFFYQAELLIKTVRRGCRYAEVPYRLNRRHGGASKATTWRAFARVLRAYVAIFADVYFARPGNG